MRTERKISHLSRDWSRREFSYRSTLVTAGFALFGRQQPEDSEQSPVALVQNEDRTSGLRMALELFGQADVHGKDVYLKASFNSANEFPATTHPETLSMVVNYLREQGCADVCLVERSGMGSTRAVWQKLRIPDLAKSLEVKLLSLEEIPPTSWRKEALNGSHWKQGVEVPGFLTPETCLVQICNLKTHRFGGHFSASLKNSIGLVAKFSHGELRHNYMEELHSSPHQRFMIAEVNQIYMPVLVVMDASQVFVDGGPERGELAYPKVFAVSKDRVALDAVGVALLRAHGVASPLNRGSVFDQEQLKRAVELKLGAGSAKSIKILTSDDSSRKLAAQLQAILERVSEEKKL